MEILGAADILVGDRRPHPKPLGPVAMLVVTQDGIDGLVGQAVDLDGA